MFKHFQKFPELKFGLSGRADGSMGVSAEKYSENFIKYCLANSLDITKVVRAGLVHKDRVVEVTQADGGRTYPDCDGLYTRQGSLPISVTVADCFPIYFYNPQIKAIGLAHCGWRGAVSRLIPNVVEKFGTNLSGLLVGVGPGIGPCHFEIKDELLEKFAEYPEAIIQREGKIYVNLPLIIENQLKKSGVLLENLEFSGKCTFCEQSDYFSFRRDKPDIVEAMAAYICF